MLFGATRQPAAEKTSPRATWSAPSATPETPRTCKRRTCIELVGPLHFVMRQERADALMARAVW